MVLLKIRTCWWKIPWIVSFWCYPVSVLRHPMHPKITFTLKIEFLISKDKFSKQRPSTGVTLDDVYIHLKNSENEWWLKPGQEMLSMWPALYARWRKTLYFSKTVYWSTKDKFMFLLFRVTPDVTPGTFKNLCEIDRKLSEARRDKEKKHTTFKWHTNTHTHGTLKYTHIHVHI